MRLWMRRRYLLVVWGCAAIVSLCGEERLETPREGTATLVVLPDTQYYYPDQGRGNLAHWLAQMNWIRNNAETHNILYVLHLGDITDGNDNGAVHREQWELARTVCEGILERAPLALSTGNHDGDGNDRNTLFSEPAYFGSGSPYAEQASLVETMEEGRYENSLHFFDIGERGWMILSLEWGISEEAMAWAESVLTRYPERLAIVLTHAYLFRDSSRYDWSLMGEAETDERQRGNPLGYGGIQTESSSSHDGQDLWDEVLRRHANVRLVLNGHVSRSGQGKRVSVGDHGQVVHQHLINYQHWFSDGGGRMRVYRVGADGETVEAISFEAATGELISGQDQQFRFALLEDPLAGSYREALAELEPMAYFPLSGERRERPILNRGRIGGLAALSSSTEGDAGHFDNSEDGIFIPYRQAGGRDWTVSFWLRGEGRAEGSIEEAMILEQEGGPDVRLHLRFKDLEGAPTEAAAFSGSRGDEDSVLDLEVYGEIWGHFSLVKSGGEIRAFWEGQLLETLPVSPSSRLENVRLNGPPDSAPDWRASDLALFNRALDYPELEWLRLSAWRQPLVGAGEVVEETFDTVASAPHGTAPGIRWFSENPDELQFRMDGLEWFRVNDFPGRSRDLYARSYHLPLSLEYGEGVLLSNRYATGAGQNIPALPGLGLKAANPREAPFFGEDYAGTRQSVFNWRRDPGISLEGGVQTIYFPYSGKTQGAQVAASGSFLSQHHGLSFSTIAYRFQDGSFRIPVAPDREVPLIQSRIAPWEGHLVKFEGEWGVVLVNPETGATGERLPFSFVLADRNAEGYRCGWYDPEAPAEPTPWKRIGPGVYRAEGEGSLFLTPGRTETGLTRFQIDRSEPGAMTVRVRDRDSGEAVDAPFAWLLYPEYGRTFRVSGSLEARVVDLLEDASLGTEDWGYSRRLGWFFCSESTFPWIWLPEGRWLYLLFSGSSAEGFWAFDASREEILFFPYAYPEWAYSYTGGWLRWPPANPANRS